MYQSNYKGAGAVLHSAAETKSGLPDWSQNGSLGIYTKSSSPPLSTDQKIRDSRASRYHLQMVARRIAIAEGNRLQMEHPANFHRVAKCKWIRVEPEVRVKLESEKAFYTGLTVCGSVWGCPICASKIQQGRRAEAQQVINYARANNKQAVLVTFTFPHYINQSLSDLLGNLTKALARLRSGKAFQNFKERVGFLGLVRSLEVTVGRNGWHPHTHELWIIDKDTNPQQFSLWVSNRWYDICSSLGMIPDGKEQAFRSVSTDFHFDADESDYLAKQDDDSNWSIAHEMTLSACKTKGVTVHPFALLEWSHQGDKRASSLFVEYIKTMHGKRQMYFSPGLKKLAGVDEIDDELLADLEEPQADTVAKLEAFAWKFVCETGKRSYVLELAETGGADAIETWLKLHGYNSIL